MNKIAILIDIIDCGKENEVIGDRKLKVLSSIDFDASDWMDKLSSIQVELIILKKETFLNIMPKINPQVIDFGQGVNLTVREKEILSLSAGGKMIKEMAMNLKISEKTIKSHLGNIYTKLGVRNRTEAISWYYKRNDSS